VVVESQFCNVRSLPNQTIDFEGFFERQVAFRHFSKGSPKEIPEYLGLNSQMVVGEAIWP